MSRPAEPVDTVIARERERRITKWHKQPCHCQTCVLGRDVCALADEVEHLRAWKAERLARFSEPLPEHKPVVALRRHDLDASYARGDEVLLLEYYARARGQGGVEGEW